MRKLIITTAVSSLFASAAYATMLPVQFYTGCEGPGNTSTVTLKNLDTGKIIADHIGQKHGYNYTILLGNGEVGTGGQGLGNGTFEYSGYDKSGKHFDAIINVGDKGHVTVKNKDSNSLNVAYTIHDSGQNQYDLSHLDVNRYFGSLTSDYETSLSGASLLLLATCQLPEYVATGPFWPVTQK